MTDAELELYGQGQYAQIGQRPKPPGTLVEYKRRFRDDLVGLTERQIREQWQELMDEYEESREPSTDALLRHSGLVSA